MRSILLLLALALAACDRGAQGAAPVAVEGECIPMPEECPEKLECTVTMTEQDGQPVRVCGGTSCCQSFCETNGCARCCVTPSPRAP